MATNKDVKGVKGGKLTDPAQVRDAISSFEQILEAIPNDRLALQTIFDAYNEVGETNKALEYLVRLANAIADDGDAAAAAEVAPKLRTLGGDDASARKALDRLDRLGVPQKPAAPLAAKKVEMPKRKMVDITAELTLAWNLVKAGELTQEDYANIVHDLSESSSKNVEVPISVLHVLHDRSFKGLDRILNWISADAKLPILHMGSFELQKEAYSLLPIDYMMHRGAIVFEMMGPDALVALLNPYDSDLREEVKRVTGRNCHFYLVPAESYDGYLDNIRRAIRSEEEKQEREKA
jgi:hypothetical protein